MSPRLHRPGAILLCLGALVAVLLCLELALGSVSIPLGAVWRALTGGEVERASWVTIVQDVRLPRAIAAMLAGGALAACGLLMQTYFRNPLADPFVLGISAGASLGVALLIVATGGALHALVGATSLAVAASLGAGAALLAVLVVSRRVEGATTILILGLMFGYLTSSLVSILLHLSTAERVKAYIAWTFGSFSGVSGRELTALAATTGAGLLAALAMAKPLNALLLGEEYARTMGLDARRARLALLTCASLLSGAVVAFCGPVGFVGIAAPHLARGLTRTADHRLLLPASILVGATVALAADLLSQLPGGDRILPLNAVTSLLGAPVVVWVLLRQRESRG